MNTLAGHGYGYGYGLGYGNGDGSYWRTTRVMYDLCVEDNETLNECEAMLYHEANEYSRDMPRFTTVDDLLALALQMKGDT